MTRSNTTDMIIKELRDPAPLQDLLLVNSLELVHCAIQGYICNFSVFINVHCMVGQSEG